MAGKGERKSNGQFAPGHPGGPGRPRKDKELEAQYYAILQTQVTPDDFRDIADKLVFLAKRGNMQAVKLLFEYLLGSPEQYLNVSSDLNIAGFEEMLEKAYGNGGPDVGAG